MDDKKYKELFKIIRPYLNYNIDLRKKLSTNNKRMITKYFNQYKELTKNSKTKIYRSTNKNNLKKVQDTFHDAKTLPKWKAAFVPYTSKEAPSITVNKKGVVVSKNKRSKLKRYYITIPDKLAFALNPRETTQELLNIHGVPANARLSIMTGDYFSHEIFEAEILPDIMDEWGDKYDVNSFVNGFVSPLQRY